MDTENKEKKFVSLEVGSKLTGYTQDYLQRLCRLNKVDCRIAPNEEYALELESLLRDTQTILLSFEGINFMEKTDLREVPKAPVAPDTTINAATLPATAEKLIKPDTVFSVVGRAVVSGPVHSDQAVTNTPPPVAPAEPAPKITPAMMHTPIASLKFTPPAGAGEGAPTSGATPTPSRFAQAPAPAVVTPAVSSFANTQKDMPGDSVQVSIGRMSITTTPTPAVASTPPPTPKPILPTPPPPPKVSLPTPPPPPRPTPTPTPIPTPSPTPPPVQKIITEVKPAPMSVADTKPAVNTPAVPTPLPTPVIVPKIVVPAQPLDAWDALLFGDTPVVPQVSVQEKPKDISVNVAPPPAPKVAPSVVLSIAPMLPAIETPALPVVATSALPVALTSPYRPIQTSVDPAPHHDPAPLFPVLVKNPDANLPMSLPPLGALPVVSVPQLPITTEENFPMVRPEEHLAKIAPHPLLAV